MLLPGFLFYLVYQLLKHRLLPYPTYEQLRARHQAAVLAESFGDALISTESHSGPWKSSEGYSGLGTLGMGIANATAAAQGHAENMKVSHMMKMAMGAGKGALTGRFKKDKSTIDPEAKMSTLEDDRVLQGAEARHAGDWRRLAVLITEELADVHERAKNLFLWRRPESTLTYTMVRPFFSLIRDLSLMAILLHPGSLRHGLCSDGHSRPYYRQSRLRWNRILLLVPHSSALRNDSQTTFNVRLISFA